MADSSSSNSGSRIPIEVVMTIDRNVATLLERVENLQGDVDDLKVTAGTQSGKISSLQAWRNKTVGALLILTLLISVFGAALVRKLLL